MLRVGLRHHPSQAKALSNAAFAQYGEAPCLIATFAELDEGAANAAS
jgi:hypothetical protein